MWMQREGCDMQTSRPARIKPKMLQVDQKNPCVYLCDGDGLPGFGW